MNPLSIADANFLIFIAPGFLVVWTFRYCTNSTKQGEFEYLGLSFVWGLILFFLVTILSLIIKPLSDLLKSIFGATFILPLFGAFLGWMGSQLVRYSWFKKFEKYIKD